ncbi:MAG TPA: OsmC family peroxiredoxin [Vicinamibacterales bacterium]|jgi:osmotically inducible protein OsmC|nr:OsmC family peroxiredoxin [Vicinamibacterales bacterium]
MAVFDRNATTDWEGGLLDGKGVDKAGTGAFSLPVTFANRVGEAGGKTSPEELMAAAHAACFAMALNAALGKKGAKAKKTHVTATVSADKSDAGIKIVSSKLKVLVEGLEGMTPADFAAFVKEADKGCPVSNAYRGTMQIDVEGSAK